MIQKARQHIKSLGLYGTVSVEQFDGKALPYNDNIVNLLVAESPLDIPEDEILRVLVPHSLPGD